MNFFWLFVLVLSILLIVFLGLDFSKFVNAKAKGEKTGLKCDAGGVLFVQGNRTYYRMPNGERRKIADLAMDLTPGSADMNQFTEIMNRAAKDDENRKRLARMDAKKNMAALSKELAE